MSRREILATLAAHTIGTPLLSTSLTLQGEEKTNTTYQIKNYHLKEEEDSSRFGRQKALKLEQEKKRLQKHKETCQKNKKKRK